MMGAEGTLSRHLPEASKGVAFAQFVPRSRGASPPPRTPPAVSPSRAVWFRPACSGFVRRFWLEKATTFVGGRGRRGVGSGHWAGVGGGVAIIRPAGAPGQAWSEHRWPRSARLQVATQAPRIFSPVKGKLRAAAELQCSRTPADGPASELRGSTCQAPWQCRWVGVYVCVCEGEPPLPG